MTTDRLWADLYEGGRHVDSAHFAVWDVPANAGVYPQLDKDEYARGETAILTAEVYNWTKASYNTWLDLTVTDARHTVFYTATLPLGLGPHGSATAVYTFTVPSTAAAGVSVARLDLRDGSGQIIGTGKTTFRVPASPLASTLDPSLALTPGLTQTVPVTVTNTSAGLNVATGHITLTLYDPYDEVVATDEQDFAGLRGRALAWVCPWPFPRSNSATIAWR